jgi:hypothetical protein
MKWQQKLNKKELRHMMDFCNGTIKGLKNNIKHTEDRDYPCYECKAIARKLKIEVKP